MNWRVLKTVCAAVVFSAWMTPACSQNHYLVIGSFTTDNTNNVREFTSYLPTGSDTAYTIQTDHNMLRLHVMKTSGTESVVVDGWKLQPESAFNGAAMSNGPEARIVNAEIKNPTGTENTAPILASAAMTEAGSGSSGDAISGGAIPAKPRSNSLKFTIASADGKVLPAQVHHVDFATGKELAAFAAESYIDLGSSPTQPMTLVCGVFGYKEVEKYIDFANLSRIEGAYRDDEGAWVIPYKLERLEKGDVSVMYNVSFHQNAVMMTPQSRLDLEELYSLMNSNPNYVIKVHAHCNGKKARNILTWGADRNFFDVTGAQQIEASAKELTNLRAEAIKSYLTERGIPEARVKTYGWGGTEMLVPATDVNAKLNDRIEIEILKD